MFGNVFMIGISWVFNFWNEILLVKHHVSNREVDYYVSFLQDDQMFGSKKYWQMFPKQLIIQILQ